MILRSESVLKIDIHLICLRIRCIHENEQIFTRVSNPTFLRLKLTDILHSDYLNYSKAWDFMKNLFHITLHTEMCKFIIERSIEFQIAVEYYANRSAFQYAYSTYMN